MNRTTASDNADNNILLKCYIRIIVGPLLYTISFRSLFTSAAAAIYRKYCIIVISKVVFFYLFPRNNIIN